MISLVITRCHVLECIFREFFLYIYMHCFQCDQLFIFFYYLSGNLPSSLNIILCHLFLSMFVVCHPFKSLHHVLYQLSKKKTLCTDGFTRKLFKTLGNNANYIQNILENTIGRNTFQSIDETTLPWHQNQRKNLQENNRTPSLMNVKVIHVWLFATKC